MTILIAHRGLIDGPDPELENNPNIIMDAISSGYMAEVDLRISEGGLWLGHDYEQYNIDEDFLKNDRLIVHCKDMQAFSYMINFCPETHFFWHDKDEYTITSKGWIWAYPTSQLFNNCIAVLPELKYTIDEALKLNVKGICSDYVGLLKETV